MSKKLLAFILAWALLPVLMFAQSNGKVAGVVTDKETGEALVGVNVYLEGTSLGSATDEDGYYVILGVPVGTYTIVAEYVGYTKVSVEGMRVSAGVTTNQDFAMSAAALQLENVVIVAKRDLVKKNVTSSVSVFESGDIQKLPLRGLTNIVSLSPSVVVQNGHVHIRGSRSDEVGYYLDGADMANPVSRNRAVTVINEAMEEVGVETGAYDAEFGGANGGIIRAELRSGGTKWQGALEHRGDGYWAAPGESFLGATSTGLSDFILTVGGPVFKDNIRFFLAQEFYFQRDRNPRFYEPFSYKGLEVETYNAPELGKDTIDIVWDGKLTPHNSIDRKTTNATMLFDYKTWKLKLGGTYSFSTWENNNAPIENILNDRTGLTDNSNLLLNAKFTYVLNPKMFLDVRGTYFFNSTERRDPFFDNHYTKWYDPNEPVNSGFYHGYPYSYDVYSFYFDKPNNPYWSYYSKSRQEYYGGAADFTGQLSKVHEFKAGFDVKAYTIRSYSVYAGNRTAFTDMNVYNDPQKFAFEANVSNYGYDVYGADLDDGFDGPKNPLFFSTYAQDKMEFNDLILKVGLRLDYFDSDDRRFKDPENPLVVNGVFPEEAYEDVDPFVEVSPRISMSFPATEKTVFYTAYGKFVQMTQLSNIYAGNYRVSEILTGGFAYLNPVGRGLEPTRTTNYEIGMRQQIGESSALDVSAFYRNIKGQIQPQRIVITNPNSPLSSYNTLVNGTFVTTKGVEIKYTLRRTNRLMAQLSYAYTDAKGTGSATNSAVAALEQSTEQPTVISPLDFNQKHKGTIVLDYRFGKNDGGAILEQSGLNLIFGFASGHPFTKSGGSYGQTYAARAAVDFETDTRARIPLEPIGNSTTPWTSNMDLRLDKTIDITGDLAFNIYLEVLNLLDTKNVLNVYSRTGLPDDDGFINNFVDNKMLESAINKYGEGFRDFYYNVNIKNGEAYRAALGRELYGTPRQVRLGLKLSF